MKLLKIKRDGNEIELTEKEMRDAYYRYREQYMKDWLMDLFDEYGYDTSKISDDLLDSVYDVYMNIMDGGDDLGELEHNAFEYAIYEPDIEEQLKGCMKDE